MEFTLRRDGSRRASVRIGYRIGADELAAAATYAAERGTPYEALTRRALEEAARDMLFQYGASCFDVIEADEEQEREAFAAVRRLVPGVAA